MKHRPFTYFVLGMVLGDNLGLNVLLGFAGGFTALYFCRFCKISYRESQHTCIEDQKLLRDEKTFELDLAVNNFKQTGVHFDSILNSIKSFHVTRNFAVDIMHDFYEGVCRYDVSAVLNYFIESNLFSLDEINDLKANFNYGQIEIGNISRYIHRVDGKLHFKLSAREMMSFIYFFPLIFGDKMMKNHPDDPVWAFVLNFVQIHDLLMQHRGWHMGIWAIAQGAKYTRAAFQINRRQAHESGIAQAKRYELIRTNEAIVNPGA